jgi:hypothetical protein
MTEKEKATIREALNSGRHYAMLHMTEDYPTIKDIDKALAILDAEPPQADAAIDIEELAKSIEDIIEPHYTTIVAKPEITALIAFHDRAILDAAAQRATMYAELLRTTRGEYVDGLCRAIRGE